MHFVSQSGILLNPDLGFGSGPYIEQRNESKAGMLNYICILMYSNAFFSSDLV